MERIKNTFKNKKAITLISLVVTIVVLVILAAVAINMAIGNNGLFNKTKLAKGEYVNASEKEKEDIDVLTNDIDASSGNISSARDYETEINNLKAQLDAMRVQNTMSSTEHFTGEYYYNGKPIYEKSLYIASLPNNCEKIYNHGITNIEDKWFDSTKSLAKWTSGHSTLLPYVHGVNSNNNIGIHSLTTTEFRISTGVDRSSVSAIVTIRFTRTTDTGNTNTLQAVTAN